MHKRKEWGSLMPVYLLSFSEESEDEGGDDDDDDDEWDD